MRATPLHLRLLYFTHKNKVKQENTSCSVRHTRCEEPPALSQVHPYGTILPPLSSVFAPIKLILQRKLDNTSCEEFGRLDLQHNTSL